MCYPILNWEHHIDPSLVHPGSYKQLAMTRLVVWLRPREMRRLSWISDFVPLHPPLPGGNAGEEVWGLLPEPQSRQDHPDSLPPVPHEQELWAAPQLSFRESHVPPHHPFQHADAVLLWGIWEGTEPRVLRGQACLAGRGCHGWGPEPPAWTGAPIWRLLRRGHRWWGKLRHHIWRVF